MVLLKRRCGRRIRLQRWLATTRLPDRKSYKHHPERISTHCAKSETPPFMISCILSKIPVEWLLSHTRVRYQESQTVRMSIFLRKALLTAFRICLVAHLLMNQGVLEIRVDKLSSWVHRLSTSQPQSNLPFLSRLEAQQDSKKVISSSEDQGSNYGLQRIPRCQVSNPTHPDDRADTQLLEAIRGRPKY
jgi:hypothetical protein